MKTNLRKLFGYSLFGIGIVTGAQQLAFPWAAISAVAFVVGAILLSREQKGVTIKTNKRVNISLDDDVRYGDSVL